MSRGHVERIAEAVLYEGYILYPYRPSVKNRQRWTFGGLYPVAYCDAAADGSASSSQTECLIKGSDATMFEARVRFLHLTSRQAAEATIPCAEWTSDGDCSFHPVDVLRVGNRLYQTWQEAEERAVPLPTATLGALRESATTTRFRFPGGRHLDPIRDAAGAIVGQLIREQNSLDGLAEISAMEVASELFRVTLRVTNLTPVAEDIVRDRDQAILCSFASTHAVLSCFSGSFLSLVDPPEFAREAAAACRNIGTWPVLVGEEGQADTMLSAPIILYDYPQVAPESPGNFFDGTEIDEMLTLRIMTLTDAEKGAMAAVDNRAGALLERTEAMAREHLLGLHGVVRELRTPREDDPHA
jgi:hypothetical protein